MIEKSEAISRKTIHFIVSADSENKCKRNQTHAIAKILSRRIKNKSRKRQKNHQKIINTNSGMIKRSNTKTEKRSANGIISETTIDNKRRQKRKTNKRHSFVNIPRLRRIGLAHKNIESAWNKRLKMKTENTNSNSSTPHRTSHHYHQTQHQRTNAKLGNNAIVSAAATRIRNTKITKSVIMKKPDMINETINVRGTLALRTSHRCQQNTQKLPQIQCKTPIFLRSFRGGDPIRRTKCKQTKSKINFRTRKTRTEMEIARCHKPQSLITTAHTPTPQPQAESHAHLSWPPCRRRHPAAAARSPRDHSERP
jgi:hypothetical protein